MKDKKRKYILRIILLGFGLPVFMLPEKMEGEGKGSGVYRDKGGRTSGSLKTTD